MTALRDALIAHGLLMPMGVDGLYGRDARFEGVIAGVDAMVARAGGGDGAEFIRFPPGMAGESFERSGYMGAFPQLAGTVHCFCGDERAHRRMLARMQAGEDWAEEQRPSGVVLAPAACYPLYPLLATRGPLPKAGKLVDLQSWCFRREPSLEPTRQQMFRMHEWVKLGAPEQVLAEREEWMRRGRALVEALALPYEIEVANDPFFGRGGAMLAASQREQGFKFELLVPVNDGLGPTACVSFNYHAAKFGDTFGLRTADGGVAHSGCVGFGLERIAVALFRHHGLVISAWPAPVRRALEL